MKKSELANSDDNRKNSHPKLVAKGGNSMSTQKGGKKGKVGILVNGKPKLIRFGDASMGHNYSPEARKTFKARHAKNIAKGPTSAAYWANKCLWAGPSGSKKSPPKGQKHRKG